MQGDKYYMFSLNVESFLKKRRRIESGRGTIWE
jgi:hypothetical protein